MIDSLKSLPLNEILGKEETQFHVAPAVIRRVSTARVQYNATLEEIEKVRTCLKNPTMGYGPIGRHALDYFIEQECP